MPDPKRERSTHPSRLTRAISHGTPVACAGCRRCIEGTAGRSAARSFAGGGRQPSGQIWPERAHARGKGFPLGPLLQSVQERPDAHSDRRHDSLGVRRRVRGRDHHPGDRHLLRGPRIRPGVPRGAGARRLEGHAGADDHGAARRRGTRDRVEGAGARGRAGAGGGRQDPGRCAARREPLHPLRRGAADRRVAAGDQGAGADAPGGAGGRPQEHGLHRNDRDLRPRQGGGVRHRHAERVRQDRSGSRCRRAREDPARAPHRRDRQVAGHHHPGHLRAGDRRQHRAGSPGTAPSR